jgi:DNA modification methylase
VVIAGNKTLQSAIDKGFPIRVVQTDGKELVVVQRTDLDLSKDKAAKELAIADNRIAELDLTWSPDVLAGFADEGIDLAQFWNDDELAALLGDVDGETKPAPDAQMDKAEELQAKWQVQRGDLYAIGDHRLLCGDSTNADDVARVMAGEKAQLMVTDPPYGVDYDPEWRNEAAAKGLIAFASGREGKVANDDRVDWSEAWALFEGDVVYCWHADRHASKVQSSLESCGFEMRSQVIWAKPRFVISRGHYHWQHEPCWYAVRKGATADWIGDHSQTTLWEIPINDDVDQKSHGTQKPTECMARPIRNHGAKIVYDPFGGSGTTMVAAQNLKRRCRMIEIEPKYCAVILERMSQMSGIMPQKVTHG